MWHRMASIWGVCLTRLICIRITVKNQENLYREGNSIIICNHQAYSDIPILYSSLNLLFVWMIKKSLYRIPLFGWVLKAAGYIPVDRTNKKSAGNSLYEAATAISSQKSSVIIFPEGTSGYKDGSQISFKKGAFLLAKKCKAVIQPITINNSHKVLPGRNDGYLVSTINLFVPVEVIFHPPIYPEDYEQMNTNDLVKKVETIVGNAIQKDGRVQ